MIDKKRLLRLKRHTRILMRISGNAQRPRLCVRRSLKHLSAQAIDDAQGKILLSLSTLDKSVKQKFTSAGNVKAASLLGELFAQMAKEKGITKIAFDRAGYLYHGRIKAFAEALRKGGLEF